MVNYIDINMSSQAPSDRYPSSTSTKGGTSINAGIDSSFTNNPIHRGSLTPDELDTIHQTNSFKQAKKLEKEDNRELAAKTKTNQQINQSNK